MFFCFFKIFFANADSFLSMRLFFCLLTWSHETAATATPYV